MEQDHSSLTIKLSQEELLLILARYRLPFMIGMDKSLQHLSEEHLGLLFGAAERSLRARDLLRPSSGSGPEVETVLLAMVAACAQPEKTLLITRIALGQEEELITLNLARNMSVLHIPLTHGLHQFTALPSIPEAVQLIVAYFDLPGVTKEMAPAGEIDEVNMQQARSLAGESRLEEAAAALREALSPGPAQLLAEALGDPQMEASFVLVDNREQEARVMERFRLLTGVRSAWLLVQRGEGPSRRYLVRRAFPGVLREAISQMFSESEL